MSVASAIFNVSALAFSFIAVLISAASARLQATGARRANLIMFVAELGQRTRSQDFREAQDYILTQLSQFNPELGIYSLPEPSRAYILLVGGFYQDVGVLVVTGVLDEDVAAAIYYANIKQVWRALEPYIYGERKIRESKGAGSIYGDFEHLAAYVESVPHDKLVRKFHRRRFTTIKINPDASVISVAATQDGASQSQSPEAE